MGCESANADSEILKRLKLALNQRHDYWKVNLVECLSFVEKECPFFELNIDNLQVLSSLLSVSPVELYLAFNDFMNGDQCDPRIEICDNLTCVAKGALELKNYMLNLDKILDYNFEVKFVKCLSSCSTGPCIRWDSKLVEGVTLESLKKLISSIS